MAITRAKIPTINELRDGVLDDLKRMKINAGVARPNVSPGSESYVRAEAWAAAAQQMAANIAASQDATMPDTSEEDDLNRLADAWKGLARSNGAGATGFVKVSVTGTVTFAQGQEGTFEDGVRARVTTVTQATNNSLVPIECIDTGKRTNRSEGAKFTWTSPPSGSATVCYVAVGGLNGGKNAEDDSAFRKRFQNSLRNPAAAGSWADVAKWAEEAAPSIEKAFVYPAAQGPSTVHVAVTIAADPDTYYSRVANATQVNLAALGIVAKNPAHSDLLTQACVHEETDCVLKLSLPTHEVDGGTGGGWLNASADRWPAVGGTTPFATRLQAAPISGTRIRVTTYAAPVVDAYIAIWSNSHKEFQHTRIKTSTLVSGSTYELVLHTAIDTNKIVSGDYVSPDAEKIDDYGVTVAGSFAKLGPGEKTSSSNLLPRAYRHPLNTREWNSQFTSRDIGQLSISHDEIDHVTVTAPTLPVTPTVPASAATAPNILVIGDLAFYPT